MYQDSRARFRLRGRLPRGGRVRRAAGVAVAALVAQLSVAAVIVPTAAVATTTPDAGQYIAVSPTRVINTGTSGSYIDDTEIGQHYGPNLPLYGGVAMTGDPSPYPGPTTVNFDFLGAGGVPSSHVEAVALDVTTHDGVTPGGGAANGYLYVYPTSSGLSSPNGSPSGNDPHPTPETLANRGDGGIADNTVIVPLGDDGQVSFYNGSTATKVNLTVYVVGYVTDDTTTTVGATYAPVSPSRIADTRTGVGGYSTQLTSTHQDAIQVLGAGGIPSTGVSAVVMNLGDAKPPGNSSVTISSSSSIPAPSGSQSVHAQAGGNGEGLVVVAPDSGGKVHVTTDSSGTDFWLDVEGYYLSTTSGTTGDVYFPVNETNVVNNQSGLGISVGTGGTDPLPAASYYGSDNGLGVQVTGVGDVPATGVDAVALSITTTHAVNVTGGTVGYLTAWADGPQSTKPSVTSVPVETSGPSSSLSFIQPGSDGDIAIYNSNNDKTDLYVNIVGYFGPPQVPSGPENVSTSESGTSATASWTPPTSDGGSAITGYTVTAISADDSVQPAATTVAATARTATVAGLTSGSPYVVLVSASNAVGVGPAENDPTTDTTDISASATYTDLNGNPIGTTPTTDQTADDGDVYAFVQPGSSEDIVSSQQPMTQMTAAVASTTNCKSHQLCGTPSQSGCVTWHVYRHEISNQISVYYDNLDVYYCWSNGSIRKNTLNVNNYITNAKSWINDQGVSSKDDYYYSFNGGSPTSGHASKYTRHIQYCEWSVCWANQYPWIHEYVHADGTMYYSDGT